MQIKAKYFTNYYYRNYSDKTTKNYTFNFSLQEKIYIYTSVRES